MARIFNEDLVAGVAAELGITDLASATIGQAVLDAMSLQQRTGTGFVRMDQGVPGLEPSIVGRRAEQQALKDNIAAIYPPAEGIAELKNESSRFVKAFLNLEVSPAGCIPVTGSVTGSFGAFVMCCQCTPGRDTVLFIDPGFPIQKSQLRVLGYPWESFDIYEYRGERLRAKLEEYLSTGRISSIIYSNPNNPAWICLAEPELRIIGELATKYDVIVLEDLAYFAMDFRRDLGRPFRPPYQATVARYTDNYILFLSASKIFSYAGQRSAVTVVSDRLYARRFPALAERYGGLGEFGNVMTNAVLYMITSGSTHSTQFGLAAMLREAVDGRLDFRAHTSEYARRAGLMKQAFLRNGFHIVYDRDLDEEISDGFFFSVGYPGLSSRELMVELIYYGISSISLHTTGSLRQGIRACSSRMTDDQLALLDERLQAFNEDHGRRGGN
ncbi:MAG: pyridoxal phosphate-dependent aminotransferase [Rikenellaceae bacterium]|nr:pyridoxal phosphate-dependent aminotransferase [Rikenellaceae bacterium]